MCGVRFSNVAVKWIYPTVRPLTLALALLSLCRLRCCFLLRFFFRSHQFARFIFLYFVVSILFYAQKNSNTHWNKYKSNFIFSIFTVCTRFFLFFSLSILFSISSSISSSMKFTFYLSLVACIVCCVAEHRMKKKGISVALTVTR